MRSLLKKQWCVYKIICLDNNKPYIGKTDNINERWKEHCSRADHPEWGGCKLISKAIKKHGKDRFSIEIIERCDSEKDTFEKEIYWIAYYKCNISKYGKDAGYNLTDGGEGVAGLLWSEASRDKIRGENNHNYGKPLSQETKDKLSITLSGEGNGFYGKKHTQKTIIFLKNRLISDEQRQHHREAAQGIKHPNAKFSNIDILDIRKKWDNREYTQTEIAKQYGVKPNTINQIVCRKRWTHI